MSREADLERLLQERDWLRRLSSALVRDQAAAEDLAQDVWVRAVERTPAGVRRPRAWLATVLRNLAVSRGRSERRRDAKERNATPARMAASPPEVLARAELVERIGRHVLALPEPYRATVLLRFFEGLPPRRVAERMGVPVETVRTRLKRALARLAAELDRAQGGDRRAWAAPLFAWVGTRSLPAAATASLGALAMKKTVVAALVLVVLAFAGWQTDLFGLLERGAGPKDAAVVPVEDDGEEPVLEGRATPTPGSEAAPPARDAAPACGTWSGRVLDPEGRGVAGAEVRLAWQEVPEGEVVNGQQILVRRERERHVRPRATTDAEGRFRIERPHGGAGVLLARAKGFAPTLSARAEAGTPVDIVLTREAHLVVHVRGPEGGAVRDAEVRLVALGREEFCSVRHVLATDRTGADGTARLPVPRSHLLVLEVDAPDPSLGFFEQRLAKDRTEIEVALPRVRVVERRVVDAVTGAPVPDAYVLVLKTFRFYSFHNEPVRRRFDADAQGVVRFPHQEGYFTQYATAPGYEVVHAWQEAIRLPRATSIDGVVLAPDGEPLADAPILIFQAGGTFDRLYAGQPLVAAFSDDRGRFSAEVKLPHPNHLPNPPDRGVRTVVALHDEWPAAVEDGVVVRPGGRAQVTLRFREPASLQVTVVDTKGAPIPEQWVGLGRYIPAAETWSEEVVGDYHFVDLTGLVRSVSRATDADGRATCAGLSPGRWCVYSENVREDVELEAGGTGEVRLVLGGGLAIAGRVFEADGSPAADRQISVSGPRAASKRTDEEGRFRFTDLVDGEYTVSILWYGRGAPYYGLGRRARPGEHVELRIPTGPARLRIRVAGPPAETVEYSLYTLSGGYAPRDTGTTSLDPVEGLTDPFTPGRGLLVVKAEGWAWTAVPFDAPESSTTDVHVALAPAGAVAPRIAGGHRGKGYMVRLVSLETFPEALFDGEDDPLRYAIARSLGTADIYIHEKDGAFEEQDVRPGVYEATYGRWNQDTRTWEAGEAKRVEVRSGETTEVDL